MGLGERLSRREREREREQRQERGKRRVKIRMVKGKHAWFPHATNNFISNWQVGKCGKMLV